jgi:hypothetical protein
MGIPITEVAAVIRSKNAGPYELTLDILFKEQGIYDQIRDKNIFTAEYFADLYKIPVDNILKVIFFEQALAVKVTMIRPRPSGNIGETDVYGAQQHGPLLGIILPI